MNLTRRFFCALLLNMLGVAFFLHAQTPELINYQGKLILNGAPAQGTKTLTFAVYDDSIAGNKLWCERHDDVPVANGIFNVLLGSGNAAGCANPALSALLAITGKRYLEMQVQGGPTLGRFRMTSTAFALQAKQVESGGTSGSGWTVSGNNVYTNESVKVGIGTTNPEATLDVAGFVIIQGSDLKFGTNDGRSTGNDDRQRALVHDFEDKLIINFDGDFEGGTIIGGEGSNNLFISPMTNGNVGIGTITPTAKLHILGNETIAGVNRAAIRLEDIGANRTWALISFGIGAGEGGGKFGINQVGKGNRLIIDTSGYVGIGTTNPIRKLHVNGDGGVDDFVRLSNDGQNKNWDIGIGKNVAPGTFFIARAGTSRDFNIDSTGNVGIGTIEPNSKLSVAGDICSTTGKFITCSDLRYKKNLAPITNALDKVTRLRGVSFDWRRKEFPELNINKGRNLGFIAQEIKDVLPEVVSQDSKGYYSVAYSNVVPVLVEAIKEQQKTIQTQTQELQRTQTELENLKQRMLRLEAMITASTTQLTTTVSGRSVVEPE